MSQPTLVTAPTELPISVGDLRAHLRITDRAEDDYMAGLIEVATEKLQALAWRQFVATTYSLTFGGFGNRLVFPKPPLISVSSITYVDSGGIVQTLSTDVYEVVIDTEPGFVRRKYSQTWPSIRGHDGESGDDIVATFVCGYGAASDVPWRTRQAVTLLAAHLYQAREPVLLGVSACEVPMGICYLLDRASQVV